MNGLGRGYSVVLILGVLVAAFFAAWLSTTRVVYFAPELSVRAAGCPWNPNEPQLADFEANWFASELRGFAEPSLYLASRETIGSRPRTIRFTWLPSFHDPVVVRIDTDGAGASFLTAKLRPGGAGFFGEKPRRLERRLTQEETQTIEELVTRSELFGQTAKDCRIGPDGAQWIIEATDGPRGYAFVARWSPESGPVHDFGLAMIALTGWDVEPIY